MFFFSCKDNDGVLIVHNQRRYNAPKIESFFCSLICNKTENYSVSMPSSRFLRINRQAWWILFKKYSTVLNRTQKYPKVLKSAQKYSKVLKNSQKYSKVKLLPVNISSKNFFNRVHTTRRQKFDCFHTAKSYGRTCTLCPNVNCFFSKVHYMHKNDPIFKNFSLCNYNCFDFCF